VISDPKPAVVPRAARRTARLAAAVPARSWLTAAAGVVAALPVIASTARALAAGWMPVGDQGIVATRAYDVFTAHAPLVGQYSQASTVAGRPLYSPGPMLYWLLALPARFGAPASLALTMGIVNALSIVGAVWLARRRGGLPLMFATAAALAVMCHSLSSENLHDVFNPAAAVLPLTLLIFVSWSVACGDHALLPVAVLVASFVAQCHLAYVLPAAGLLAVALAGLAASLRADPRRSLRWILAAALVGICCWSAPLAEQVAHRHGNLGLIASTATAQRPTEGATAGWRAVIRAVGVTPRWLRAPGIEARDLGGVSGGDYGDTRLNDIWSPPGTGATVSAVVLMGLLLAAGVAGAFRRRVDVAAAAAIGLLMCAALAADVASTPRSAVNTVGYTTWWGSAAGVWLWLALGWSLATLLPLRALARPRVAALASAFGLAAVAAAGGVAAAAEKRDAHEHDYRPARTLVARLNRVLRGGETVWLVQRGFVLVPIEPAVRYALRRRDVRTLGHLASLRVGAWYELDHRRYSRIVSIWSNGNAPPVRPQTIVARVRLVDRRGRHVLAAALSPPASR
jgi:hypothetical protein